jgi:hypothetical protein
MSNWWLNKLVEWQERSKSSMQHYFELAVGIQRSYPKLTARGAAG